MQALRWHGQRQLLLDEVAEPTAPGPGQAVVEIAYCGVCGTDLHEYLHGPSMLRPAAHPLTGATPPMTLGHEMSGTVFALGPDAVGITLGMRVAVDPCLRCGHCWWCRHGDYHICEKGGSIGLAAPGAFARFVAVPVENLVPIPDGVSDEMAAVAEPLAVGLRAAKRGLVGPGDNVLVLGSGPIGIAALVGARMAGAAAVFVSEPLAQRAEQAYGFGATEVFNPSTVDVRREVFGRTGRTGPDVVIDATGRAELVELAIRTSRRGGRVVMAGISDNQLSVDLRQIVLYERSVFGSLGYNHDIPRVLDLMATGRLDASGLVTDIRPLVDAPAVFAELEADRGRQLKVLIDPKDR